MYFKRYLAIFGKKSNEFQKRKSQKQNKERERREMHFLVKNKSMLLIPSVVG